MMLTILTDPPVWQGVSHDAFDINITESLCIQPTCCLICPSLEYMHTVQSTKIIYTIKRTSIFYNTSLQFLKLACKSGFSFF